MGIACGSCLTRSMHLCVPVCRYNAMNEEVSKHKDLRTELAAEVVEARQHWIAENQYNSMLQVRGIRCMHAYA